MAYITITAKCLPKISSCPPKSDNFLVDMRCKSYCNGTNFRGNKFSQIPGETRKIKYPQSILRDTTREN